MLNEYHHLHARPNYKCYVLGAHVNVQLHSVLEISCGIPLAKPHIGTTLVTVADHRFRSYKGISGMW